MHYFVTGSTGFVGGYVTSQLLAAGHDVTALVRTRDEDELIVPNSILVQSTVKNYTLRDSMYRLRSTTAIWSTSCISSGAK